MRPLNPENRPVRARISRHIESNPCSLTFDGSFDSVGSVAHEWGHAMHAQFFQEAQPFDNAVNTSVLLFDTPSLVNEMLLSDYMIANAKSREERIVALDQAIDSLRYSYFGAISGIRS